MPDKVSGPLKVVPAPARQKRLQGQAQRGQRTPPAFVPDLFGVRQRRGPDQDRYRPGDKHAGLRMGNARTEKDTRDRYRRRDESPSRTELPDASARGRDSTPCCSPN